MSSSSFGAILSFDKVNSEGTVGPDKSFKIKMKGFLRLLHRLFFFFFKYQRHVRLQNSFKLKIKLEAMMLT